jgi:hypothetical protein
LKLYVPPDGRTSFEGVGSEAERLFTFQKTRNSIRNEVDESNKQNDFFISFKTNKRTNLMLNLSTNHFEILNLMEILLYRL